MVEKKKKISHDAKENVIPVSFTTARRRASVQCMNSKISRLTISTRALCLVRHSHASGPPRWHLRADVLGSEISLTEKLI